ncbi:DUF2891 domain-containing protein [Hirschia litorea]|uniref:DUF2891 domain-containing protein n=1 Tax=Hirschia litorea TaxID=1199156 RepID=A0ABW2IMK0_9PROT
MKQIICTLLSAVAISAAACSQQDTPPPETSTTPSPTVQTDHTQQPLHLPVPRAGVVEDRFAGLALTCLHQEYPNKVSIVLDQDSDSKPPSQLFPAFYGCFDWHSSVHGHWLLTRILTVDPDTPLRTLIIQELDKSFTPENLAGEVEYFSTNGKGAFERPYGRAWFLQLVAELHTSEDPKMQEWRNILQPLEKIIVEQTQTWLKSLAYPIRSGTHNQSSFAFGLMLDYARTIGNSDFEKSLSDSAMRFHENDINCPLTYEPSGEDFLSPCLMEADLMRRIMPQNTFATWLSAFLPDIPEDGSADWLAPGIVLDATDGKLVHLDGVNLSRAWALEGIASALPADDARRASLLASAQLHTEKGIASVSDEHYSGSHWLGSFATYLTTKRGIASAASE